MLTRFAFTCIALVALSLPAAATQRTQRHLVQAQQEIAFAQSILRCSGNPCIVHDNPGGMIGHFELAALMMHKHGIKVEFVNCRSACVMAARLLARLGNACSLPGGHFGIHMAATPGFLFFSEEITNTSYGRTFDHYAAMHGGLPPPEEMMFVPREVSRLVVPPCRTNRHRVAKR